jgi:predicted MFS family arabinose efflux permease
MSTATTHGAPSANVVFLLAAGAGLSVASIYYSQPMLGMMGADFHAGVADAGMVPTLTQLGYALGILLLAPLGDRYDRRRIILVKGALLALTLLLCAFAASFPLLLLSSLAIGLTATVAQDIIPAAATLAPEAQPRKNRRRGDDRAIGRHFAVARVQRRARRVRRLAQRLRARGAGRFADHAGDLAHVAASSPP